MPSWHSDTLLFSSVVGLLWGLPLLLEGRGRGGLPPLLGGTLARRARAGHLF